MKKINLVLVAIAATALLWCLDRATGTSEAAGDCQCNLVTIQATVGADGYAVVNLPEWAELQDNKLPIVQVYEKIGQLHSTRLTPLDFSIKENQVVVSGEAGLEIYVVISR